MFNQIEVILPVFLVVLVGYLARWRRLINDDMVEALMRFSQNFAIPTLLFMSIAQLDLGSVFDWRLLASFYIGALICFALGFFGARHLFGRGLEDSVSIGFLCTFSNSLLLGIPITERAYGTEALNYNFAIIAIHSPLIYGLGITAMETVRAQGAGPLVALKRVVKGILSTPLVIGILCGAVVNLTGMQLPSLVYDAAAMLARAGLPTALFALGGVLFLYRPEGDLRLIAWACGLSLILHPAMVFGLAHVFDLNQGQIRSAVVTAAMAPGVNAYLFANMYGAARRVAASTVLLATALSALSITLWMQLLP